MSPESIVNAASRRGSIVPELIDASVDSRICVVGSVMFLLGVGSELEARATPQIAELRVDRRLARASVAPDRRLRFL
jgi:hypothetical protein